jgi:hypothetical protein
MKLSRVSVWRALSSVTIFSPVSINGTVTSDDYLSLESDEFISFLMGYGIPMNSAWFQHDGARPYTSNNVFHFIHYVFEKIVLLNQYPVLFEEGFSWPPNSQELLFRKVHTIPH